VRFDPPEAGFTDPGVILCEQVRSVSKVRLRRFQGAMSSAVISEVEDRLRVLLDLWT
jgi:mRNA-degrading endonuclease toxin of MazEF toxin-antitoxin module